jgi:hypothetical protein
VHVELLEEHVLLATPGSQAGVAGLVVAREGILDQ